MFEVHITAPAEDDIQLWFCESVAREKSERFTKIEQQRNTASCGGRGLLLGLAGEKEVEDVTSIGNFQKPQ